MKLRVNKKRASAVVGRLNDSFMSRRGLLNDVDDLVENQLPGNVKFLSEEHARFLFYIVSNDHGVRSRILYGKAKHLFVARPKLFDPQEILSSYEGASDPRLVRDTGDYLGTRYPKETAKSWYLNSQRLQAEFEGSALKLFTSEKNADSLFDRITEFRGYGPKTGGILLRAVVGLWFPSLAGLEDVLVPVDIHDSRIAFLTGIVSLDAAGVEPDYYAFVPKIQRVLSEACSSMGVEWPDIDRSLWLIGSRGCAKRNCEECPLNDLCVRGSQMLNNI